MPESHKLPDKLDYDQITDNIFIGTNMCCQTHFEEELLQKGVTVDISLEKERLDAPFGINIFLWLPTPNNNSPSKQTMQAGIAMLKHFKENSLITYVHCRFGHGRAPTLVAGYLIQEKGMSVDKAIEYIKSKRSVIHLEDVQIKALKKLERVK